MEFPSEAQSQVDSKTWLAKHSLQSNGLTLDQLLPKLGFKQCQGTMAGTSKVVTSLYSNELFVQQPDSIGNIYNICVTDTQLHQIEQLLINQICIMKSRIKWLNSSSRLVFGTVNVPHIFVIIDSTYSNNSSTPFMESVKLFIKEQVANISKFSLIRSTCALSTFSKELCTVSSAIIQDAIDWINHSQPNTLSTANITEAVSIAVATEGVDEIYVLSEGQSSLRSTSSLNEIFNRPVHIPVHFSIYECTNTRAIEEYMELCQSSRGRLHVYNAKCPLYNPVTESRPSSAQSSTTSINSSFKPLPREDVLLVWEELERGRDTLAIIQAIQLDRKLLIERNRSVHSVPAANREQYMSSEEWIKVHGLKKNLLLFSDFIKSLAFHHCEGVLHSPDHTHSSDDIYSSKIVSAKYCKDFVHLKLDDGRVIHIHLDEKTYSNYCSKLQTLIKQCNERSDWLKKGSRELFGTILEDNIVVVIDTSISLERRLGVVKRKLYQLLKEQISNKTSFNLIQFNTEISCWREHLVPVTTQSLAAAREWINDLVPAGNTDTLSALRKAMNINGTEAVYLLTDGRPDQSTDDILSIARQWWNIPIHTISFNCADSKANNFLYRLSSITNGRYHFYSEDMKDVDGPATYQSDDLQLLSNEVTIAQEQLVKAQNLYEECFKLQHLSCCKKSIAKPVSNNYKKQQNKKLNRTKWLKNKKRNLALEIHQTESQAAAAIETESLSPWKREKPMPIASSLCYNADLREDRNVFIKRSQQVIGQDPNDGLYYLGVVTSRPVDGLCNVLFSTGIKTTVSTKLLLPVGGSSPCPILHCHDFVLTRSRVKNLKGDLYLPGIVRAVPENPRVGGAFYSVSLIGGKLVTCNRSSLVKIGCEFYRRSCDQVVTWLGKNNSCIGKTLCSLLNLSSGDTLCNSVTVPYGNVAMESNDCEPHPVSPEPHPLLSEPANDVPIDSPTVPVDSPILPVHSPTLPVDSPTLPVDSPTVPVDSPILPVDSPTLPVDSPTLPVDSSTLPVDSPVDSSIDSPTLPVDSPTLPVDSSTLPVDKPVLCSIETNTEPVLSMVPEMRDVSTSTELLEITNDEFFLKDDDLTLGMLDSTHISKLDSTHISKSVIGSQALVRWSDDGWYYRCYVIDKQDDTHWTISDANNDTEVCLRDDIITDHDDALISLQVNDLVIALHPFYPHSYAPGHVTGLMADGHYIVELYDNTQGILPRHEIYSTTTDKHKESIDYIKLKEQSWIRKSVIARKSSDHLFHRGVVLEQQDNSKQYLIRWMDNSTQITDITDMFGKLTRPRPLYTGDYIIALPESSVSTDIYYPGKIIGLQKSKLIVELPNKNCFLASSENCYWISYTYYISSIDYSFT